jgi:hypothetical protein
MWARSERAIALVCAIACARPLAASPRKEKAVIEILRQVAMLEPTPVSMTAVPIVEVINLRVPLAEAPLPAGAACERQFCNTSLNSRFPAAAPAKQLQVRWKASFVDAFKPGNIVQGGDRVLAYGGGVWRLFDLNGAKVADGRTGSSGMVIDTPHGFFYFINGNGLLAAHRLVDGLEDFKLFPAPGDAWPFIARQGNRFFDLGVQLPQPWSREPRTDAVLEHQDLGEGEVQRNRMKMASNLVENESLHFNATAVQMAMHGEEVIFAVPGNVVLSSNDLHPRGGLDADFVPRFLSVDELGRIHLIVRTGEQTALWILTPAGQRTAAVVFKPEYGTPLAPPIIGYDHRIFLLHSGLTAFDAYGDLLWERWPRGRVVGGGITTDGRLLITDGDLAAYDPQGERKILFALPGVTFITPPAMSASGEVFVASSDSVYCLAPRRE